MIVKEAIKPFVPDLRRYARALALDAEHSGAAADDLVHRTMAQALRDERLRHGAVRVTLFAIVTTLNRTRVRAACEAGGISTGGGATARPSCVATRAPFEPVHRTRIEQAIARLPLDLREALLLVALEKMTYEDAASVTGVPTATLLARLTRARDDLRHSFNGMPQEPAQPLPPRQAARRHLRLVK